MFNLEVNTSRPARRFMPVVDRFLECRSADGGDE
jgi:hypothetical protein